MGMLVTVFKALADETRLRIINLLFTRNLCVCEVQEILQMSEPRVSRHLKILKGADLIECDKEGKWCYYKIIHNEKNDLLFTYLEKRFRKEDIFRKDIEKAKTVHLACSI